MTMILRNEVRVVRKIVGCESTGSVTVACRVGKGARVSDLDMKRCDDDANANADDDDDNNDSHEANGEN